MKKLAAGLLLLAAVVHCNSDTAGGGGVDASVDPTVDGSVLPPAIDGSVIADAGTEAGKPLDTTAPTFAGVKSATALSETDVAVTWSPATDDATPQGTIAYRAYVSPEGTPIDYATPFATSPAGATGMTLTALKSATKYAIVVRAVDASGNEDKNTASVSATTKDVTAPAFAGVTKVTGLGAHDILVEWDPATDNGSAASDITYRAFVSATAGGETFATPTSTSPPGATSITVSSLPEASTVYVVVRAVDASGNSDSNKREKLGFTLDKTPPTFAGAATAKALGTSVHLTWLPASDTVDPQGSLKYDVFVATAPGAEAFGAAPLVTTVGGATSYTAINLNVSTTYYFVVRAKDTSGNEDANKIEVSAVTAASPDIQPPTFAGLATATAIGDTAIDLSWAAATDDYSPAANIVYDIFTSSSPGGEIYANPTYTTDPGATGFTLTGFQPLTTEYVVVRARDQAGNEETNTTQRQATTLADQIAPTFGGLVSATPTSPTSVQLAWNPATDDVTAANAITYQVFQASSSGGETYGSPIATSAPGAQSITVGGLQPNTAYYYVVRAVDGVGNVDANTIEKLVTTPPDTTAPLFAGAASLVALSPTSLVASWSLATDDVTAQSSIVYLPYLSTTPNGENFAVAPAPTAPNATSFTWNGLIPNTTYYVVVRARDAAGNVDKNTNEKNGATQPDTTAPVFGGAQSVGSATDSSLTVSWNPATDNVTPPGSITYQLCITTTDGACNGAAFVSSASVVGQPSYAFSNLVPDTTYFFVVRAVDNAVPPNSDTNSQQVSMKTSKDTTPPTFGGLVSAVPNGDASITLGWAAATDDITSSAQIVYDIYQATSAGTEAFSGASYSTAAGQTTFSIPFPPALLSPQTAYYYVVRARDGAGNHDGNTTEKTATTAADTTPPTFGGVTSVTAPTLTTLTANWNAAQDDITATASIVYKVCWALDSSCSTSFTAMGTSLAGATTYVITGLLAGKTYNVVVRARDNAAIPNTDANTIVRSNATLADTTPPVFTGNPSISNANATSLTLNWAQAHDNYSADANITYLVCYTQISNGCGGAGGAFSANGGTFVNQLSTSFSAFTPTQTYYFVVRAQDQVPNTDTNYNVVSVTMQNDTTAPTFAGLTSAAPAAGALGDANVTLTWTQATDNVTPQASIYYDIYQSTSHITTFTTATYTVQGVGTATVPGPATIPGLSPQTTYYYVVRARDSASNRDTNSVEKTALTNADNVKPLFGGITGLTASPTNASQMTATWTPATDDTTAAASITYLICWSTTSSCTTSFVAMDSVTGVATYTTPVRSLHQNTSYTFVVRARDASAALNTDTNTATKTATTIVDTVAPTFGGVTSVTNVAGVSPIPQQNLLVQWATAADDAALPAWLSYDICWAQSPANCTGGSFVASHTVLNATSYQIAGLNPGTTYNVVVRAHDENNNWNVANANTQIAQATMADSVAPTWGSPAGLQSATPTSPASITLGWNIASDDFSSATQLTYYVYRQSPSPGLITTVAGSATSPMSYLATGLTPNTAYCFYVQARDLAGNQDGNTHAVCASTPQIPAPTFTTQPLLVSNTDTTITINWAATVSPASTITYQVCSSLVNGGCNGFTAGSNVTAPYQITGLAPSKTYYILVRATDAGGSTYATQLTASTTADGTSPTWNGGQTATTSAPYPTYLQVAWSAASDDVGVVNYDLCWSTTAGGCSSWTTKYTTSSISTWIGAGGYNAGAGGTYGTALTPNTLYYVYIRANDAAGNHSPIAGTSATTSYSYTVNVDPIFTTNCAGCHNGSYKPGPFTWSFIYNQNASECAHKYIAPGDGANSLIYQKVSNSSIPSGCGCAMPPGATCGTVSLAGASQSAIFSWAQAGAYNN